MFRLAIIAPSEYEWDINILPMFKIGKREQYFAISVGWLVFNFEIEFQCE